MPIFLEVAEKKPKKVSGPPTKKKLKKKKKVTESKRVYGKGRGGTKETQIKKKPEMSKALRDLLKKLIPGRKPLLRKDYEKHKEKYLRLLEGGSGGRTISDKDMNKELYNIKKKGGKAKKIKAYSKGGKAK